MTVRVLVGVVYVLHCVALDSTSLLVCLFIEGVSLSVSVLVSLVPLDVKCLCECQSTESLSVFVGRVTLVLCLT